MGHFSSHPHSRRTVVLALAGVPAAARAAPCRPPRVLFVCSSGTVKSAIAREALRRRAKAEGLNVVVASRGLTPEDHVSPALAVALRADGVDPAREPALPLTQGDVAAADIVIAFDEAADAPALRRARAWSSPSWNEDYAAARQALAVRMDELVSELRGRAGGCR